jgi:LuxR family transcriptional regulator, maltose regulon positive regulatory protein
VTETAAGRAVQEPNAPSIYPERETFADPPMVVVRAKFREPGVRPEWVRRPRLVRELKSADEASLVLIDAPAGYGKSTLLAQWRAADSRPFAWVSLDSADNDPARFWSYVVQAVNSVSPSIGSGLVGRVNTPRSLRKFVLPRLLNRMDESGEAMVVVLDDYHLIRNPMCHELMSFMLENLPPFIQLVIATRADPPLGIGKLRVEHRLHEIRATDLRFDVHEATVLLRHVLGSDLLPEQVEELVQRTEGWPAAVYLAAVSLKHDDDVHGFLERFKGDNRLVGDYLAGEVLNRLPRDTYQFLLRTSILQRFTAPLASDIAGRGDCSNLLGELERSNLFLVPLDDRREWYRYHNLFQHFLYSELRRTEPDVIGELHRRASKWNRDHGYVESAVHHAIEAGDSVAARELIWMNLLPYFNRGRTETLRRWMSALGTKSIASDPVLSLAAGWVAGLAGRFDEVEKWLTAAVRSRFDGVLPDGTPLDCGIALLRAMYGPAGVSEALEDARMAEQGCDGGSVWHPVTEFILGFLLHLDGSQDEGRNRLEEAARASRSEQPVVEATALAQLSMLASDAGDNLRAATLARKAKRVSKRFPLLDLPQSSAVGTAFGRVLAGEGDLNGASVQLEQALAVQDSLPGMSPWPTMQTVVALAPVRFALGDQKGARELMRRARSILDFQPDAGINASELTRLERSLGKRLQRPALFGETLTDRELSVLRLLATPLTHRQIGESLFISLNTIKSHVRSLYRKLLVSSRTEAVAKGRELGLL